MWEMEMELDQIVFIHSFIHTPFFPSSFSLPPSPFLLFSLLPFILIIFSPSRLLLPRKTNEYIRGSEIKERALPLNPDYIHPYLLLRHIRRVAHALFHDRTQARTEVCLIGLLFYFLRTIVPQPHIYLHYIPTYN